MALKSRIAHANGVANTMTAEMMTQQIIPAYQRSLTEIRSALADLYHKYSVAGTLSYADIDRYNRLIKLEAGVTSALQKTGTTAISSTTNLIKAVYQESYYRTAFALEQMVGAGLDFGILPASQVEASIYNPLDRITWPARTKTLINKATNDIKQEITRGIIQGKDYAQVAASITERANKTAAEMQRIVQTEAHRAREAGRLDCFEDAWQKGLDIEKEWVASMDGRTRDWHAEMDGQRVPMFEEDGVTPGRFISPESGAMGPAPGQMGTAEDDINCRCSHIAEFKDLKADERRFRIDETADSYVGKDMRYLDWAAMKGIKPHYQSAYARRMVVKEEDRMWKLTEKTGLEHASFVTPAGKVHTKKVGTATQVQFKASELAKAKNTYAIHTHPSGMYGTGRGFSTADLNFGIRTNVKELRVVAGKEYYVLKRPATGWPKNPVEIELMIERYKIIREDAMETFYNMIRSGAMTNEKANASFIPHANRTWAEEFGFTFYQGVRKP